MKQREKDKAEEYSQSLSAAKKEVNELRKDYEEVVSENQQWIDKVQILEKQLIQSDVNADVVA